MGRFNRLVQFRQIDVQKWRTSMAKKIWKKISRIMKTSANMQNCRGVSKMQKNAKKLMGTFSKYFLKICDIRRYSKNILKMFPLIFLHFWNPTAILHICWSFHNPRNFSSYFFSHLKAATSVHLFAEIVPTD